MHTLKKYIYINNLLRYNSNTIKFHLFKCTTAFNYLFICFTLLARFFNMQIYFFQELP